MTAADTAKPQPLTLGEECSRCGITFRRALFTAALVDLGARASINPLQCEKADGALADHDFQPAAKAKHPSSDTADRAQSAAPQPSKDTQ